MALVAGALPVLAATVATAVAPATAAAATKTYGSQPLDDIVAAATEFERLDCGLNRNELAAMMMAPTFSETGAPADKAPSPMTLSRWDTQPALWAFGDPATTYQKAFWHPGIGLWQFDSAGFWDMTAADAINTQVAARQAAQVMSSRYCASSSTDVATKMKYAWSPWYGCASGSVNCLAVYDLVTDGTSLRNLVRDTTVGRLGGMQQRTCRIAGIGEVTCFHVDPAKAEGYKGFASPTGAPTPISAPFYVFRANDREYRYWLKEDSGYGATVVASKPVRADARKSLTWSTVEQSGGALCDATAIRGACTPFGVVDVAAPAPGALVVSGWAIDPDSSAATEAHIYVDGVGRANLVADDPRPDVGAAMPQYGPDHGFSVTLPTTPGPRQVCVYAIDRHGIVVGNVLLRCTTVTVPTGSPFGVLDAVVVGSGALRVSGWAIDPDTVAPANVHVYVDGVGRANVKAGVTRADLGRAFPGYGAAHGFDIPIAGVAPGPRSVCVFAVDAAAPGGATSLGCRTVTVPTGSPFGAFDAATASEVSVSVSGWAIDPDTAEPIDVHVYVDGVGRANLRADRDRKDVGKAYPGWGPAHGWATTIGGLSSGAHQVCAYGINVGTGGNALLGCRTFEVSPSPFGALDAAVAGPVSVRVTGWAIDPDTTGPVDVHLYVDGVGRANVKALAPRGDLATRFPAWGPNHGLDVTIGGVAAGSHEVCAYAINTAGPGGTTLLGCAPFTVVGGSPFGVADLVAKSGTQLRVAGWAMDPDTPDPVDVHLYVDGKGTSITANVFRSDLATAYPTWGGDHGFDRTVTVPADAKQACLYLYNVGTGSNVSIGCRAL